MVICALMGCHNQSKQQSPPPASQPIITERPLPPRAQPMLIKQGAPPLVYMVEASATLRFADLTSGSELARALVQPRQIVSINAERGVMLGQTVLRPGPLAKDHQYGIWLEPEHASGGAIRQTTIMPTPASRPSSDSK